MTRRPLAAPMPESLRHFMRAGHHPARAVPCTHCGAAAHKPCRVPSRDVPMTRPHEQRTAAWAQQTACCPECQVEPTIPCHLNGRPLNAGRVHPRRHQEAEETAA